MYISFSNYSQGVPENEKVAIEYFRRAADSGHPGACYVSGK